MLGGGVGGGGGEEVWCDLFHSVWFIPRLQTFPPVNSNESYRDLSKFEDSNAFICV